MALDTQLRYNVTVEVAHVLAANDIPRERVWITTKIPPKVFCNASDPKAMALQLMRDNLDQLNTSYVDLALLHEPCSKKGFHPADQMAWDAMMEAVENGWARAIGVDRYTPAQMDALKGTKPAVLMGHMSMSEHDEDTLEYCKLHGIHFNAFGVMGGCKFTNPVVLSLASKYNVSTAQVCLIWTRQRGFSMALGVGTDPTKMANYIREDLDIFSFNMTDQEIDALNRLQS